MLKIASHTSRRGAALLSGLAILALWGGAALLKPALSRAREYTPAFAQSDDDREAVNMSPFAQILGEVRATAADLMWVKTERYLHRGVAFAPHIDADAMAHSGATENQAEAHHDHEAEAHNESALVPTADKDYRGWIGSLQREIEPWQGPGQPHQHEPGNELLPWYRLLTISNPHHWRGYVIGTWWLMQEAGKDARALAEAESFITEGVGHNPSTFQLLLMQGRVRLARNQFETALQSFRLATKVALKLRTRDGHVNSSTWTQLDEDDFRAAVRYIPMLLERKLNRHDEAKGAIIAALQIIPDDGPLQRMRNDNGN